MIASFFTKMSAYFNEVKAEINKVSWPNKDELIGSTIIVCILVIVFAIILGAMDSFFAYIIRNFIS